MDDASPTSDACKTDDSLDNNVAGIYQTRGGEMLEFQDVILEILL